MLEVRIVQAAGLWLLGAEPAPAPAPTPDLPSYGGLLLRTLIALAVVVALVWLGLRFGLARLSGLRSAGGPLRLLARQPLDGRRQVVLLEAAGRYFLIGVAESQVSLLAELGPQEVSAALSSDPTPARRRFADVLGERLAGRRRGRRAPEGARGPGAQPAPDPTPNPSPTPTAPPAEPRAAEARDAD